MTGFALNELSAFRVREATTDDLPTISRLWLEGSSVDYRTNVDELALHAYFAGYLEQQDKTFRIWVATLHDAVVGWQSLLPSNTNPFLRRRIGQSSTYVDKDKAPKGTGKALIAQATNHADDSDLQLIVGEIATSNTIMRHIVRSVGWQEVGVIPPTLKDPPLPERVHVVYVAGSRGIIGSPNGRKDQR